MKFTLRTVLPMAGMLSVLLTAACTTSDAAGQQVVAANAQDERVCRMTAGFAGGIGERVCGTRAEWEAHDQRRASYSATAEHELRYRLRSEMPTPPAPPPSVASGS